jgi:hypothetical protein
MYCYINFRLFNTVIVLILTYTAAAQYKLTAHRSPLPGEIPVSKPGSYAEPGRTYILTNDITSDRSTLFLGKDVTLDLNGYTVKYADGGYSHIVNGGFENGSTGWDLSKAPGAKVMNTADIHVFIGDKLMSLQPGDEIVSSYVNLPVANRSYFAMVGITGRHYHDSAMKGDVRNEMRVSVFVEDEKGNEVKCTNEYKDSTAVSCPIENRSPQLGGGFILAHLKNLPAGKYRVRVKAVTDCLVDEIDIRPAMDVGVGIVEQTWARGHNDYFNRYQVTAFTDYTADAKAGTPVAAIPVVKGRGSVTIRNGIIENAAAGCVSWGVQSTANNVKLVLDNVFIKTGGINTIAIDAPQATIVNCRFKVDVPFLVNRHGSSFYAVDLRGNKPSEVSFSEFLGGQGCLVFKGMHSEIHHNKLVNNQAVTNHYSIMAMGDSSRVYDNDIEPERGSGIEIYRQRYIDIFNNTIKVRSSPPTCEYGREEYSANAIRIADYRAKAGAPNGAYGNRVYNNKIFITAINFEQPKEYVPLAWAFFYSASAGDNDIFGNEITIHHTAPSSKALAAAFFITGGTEGFGGNFYNNRITSNVPPVWLAGKYGGTSQTKMFNNTIIKSPGALPGFKPFRMGFEDCMDCIAKNVEIRSNEVVNDSFAIQVEGKGHIYSVAWNLLVKVIDKKGNPSAGTEVIILDKNNTEILRTKTGIDGSRQSHLIEYLVTEEGRADLSPYMIKIGKTVKKVPLKKDTEITIALK